MDINTIDELRRLYADPKGRAVKKVLPAFEQHATAFIARSPFVLVATHGARGVDCSPRGGAPGFVRALDSTTLALPDAKGNNRLDSLENIIETGRAGLLFLVPGVDETLRVNGRARISVDEELLDSFAEGSRRPASVVIVETDEVFLHCAKAFLRSELWSPASRIERTDLPTMGEMLADQIGADGPIESQEDMIRRYRADL